MRIVLAGLAAALAVAALSSPAQAQSAADRADARCLLVMNIIGTSPKNEAIAVRGSYFYIGRINGRSGSRNLQSLLAAESKSIKSKDQLKAEVLRCGQLMDRLGRDYAAALAAADKTANGAR